MMICMMILFFYAGSKLCAAFPGFNTIGECNTIRECNVIRENTVSNIYQHRLIHVPPDLEFRPNMNSDWADIKYLSLYACMQARSHDCICELACLQAYCSRLSAPACIYICRRNH